MTKVGGNRGDVDASGLENQVVEDCYISTNIKQPRLSDPEDLDRPQN
jgi:hypothetical protein